MRTALFAGAGMLTALLLVPTPAAEAQQPLLAIEFENGLTVALEQDQLRVGSFAFKLSGEADDGEHGVRPPGDLQGLEVRSPSGETLGTLAQVLINPRTGRLPYAIVERTSVQSVETPAVEAEAEKGEATEAEAPAPISDEPAAAAAETTAGQRTIVPWRYFLWTEDPQQGPYFVLTLDRRALDEAPSFAPGAEPNFDQPRWHGAIDRYYESLPRERTAARDQLQPVHE